MSKRTLIAWFYGIFGVGTLANGLWMLISPFTWYTQLPAAVPDTGPINIHFVHDIGVMFSIAGAGAMWCAKNLERCAPVHVLVTGLVAGHALVHFAEILAGKLPPSHWLIDLPLVFVPALILLGITPMIVRGRWISVAP
jgi:hypothetical protein